MKKNIPDYRSLLLPETINLKQEIKKFDILVADLHTRYMITLKKMDEALKIMYSVPDPPLNKDS